LDTFCITHIPRERNERANELAQQASGYEVLKGMLLIKPGPMSWCMPDPENELAGGDGVYGQEEEADGMIQTNDVCQGNDGKSGRGEEKRPDVSCGTSTCESSTGQEGKEEDWRKCIKECINNPSMVRDRKVCRQALKYTMIDDELYWCTMEGLLLKCLNTEQVRVAMGEVHEGLCRAHQSGQKMKWTLRRAGLYWPTMVNDCTWYKRGCEACQQYGDVQTALASVLHPIIKPWPFRGWGMDFIGEVHPSTSKGQRFVLVATYYFSKWTEAVPLKHMTHKEVITFVQEISFIGLEFHKH
jgi:hypothetical protein